MEGKEIGLIKINKDKYGFRRNKVTFRKFNLEKIEEI